MEQTVLKQKSIFERREFKITKTGLDTYTKDYEIESTNSWDFDNFEKKTRIYTEKNFKFLKAGLITVLVGVVRGLLFLNDDLTRSLVSGILIIMIGLILITYYFISQKKYLLLHMDNDQQLFVMYNKPNKKEFDEFIHTFYKRRADYFRENYFYIDLEGEKEKQIQRLKWLRGENIISENEYEEAVEEVKIKMM